MRAGPIEQDLSERALDRLAADHPWAKVELDGRDLVLSGTAPSDAAKSDALRLADGAFLDRNQGTWGVRVVDGSTIADLAVVSPYKLSANMVGDTVTLTGSAPSEQGRNAIVGIAKETFGEKNVVDQLELAAGADIALNDRAAFAFSQLAPLAGGEVALSDAEFSVTGVAPSADVFSQVTEAVSGDLPAGLTLATSNITPPSASPYIFEAEKSADTITLSGNVPSTEARDVIIAGAQAIAGEKDVVDALSLASGAGEDFADQAQFAVDQLSDLEIGTASLSDQTFSLTGLAGTSAAAASIPTILSGPLPLGLDLGALDITAPVASPYEFAAEKDADAITLTGNVPSTEIRTQIVERAKDVADDKFVLDRLNLASGAGEDFADQAQFAVDQLSDLETGRASLSDADLSVTGKTLDESVAETRASTLGSTLPFGLFAKDVSVEGPPAPEPAATPEPTPAPEPTPPPAPVLPYLFSAEKTADGVVLAGSVPSEDAKRALVEAARSATDGDVIDRTSVREDAPESFENLASFGIARLGAMDEGSVSTFDETISVSGTASDPVQFAELKSVLGPNAPDDIEIGSVALDVAKVSPYNFSAVRSTDGVILSGTIPSDDMRSKLVDAARGLDAGPVEDRLVLGAGEPESFETAAVYAVEHLNRFSEGSALISDDKMSIEGTAKDATLYDAARASVKTPPSGYEVSFSRIGLPVAKPYTFSAIRNGDEIVLSGNVPNQDVRRAFVSAAEELDGDTVTDQMTRAAGEPDGFGKAANYAIAQLDRFSDGSVLIRDTAIAIDGTAKDAAAYDAALATSKVAPDGFNIASATIDLPLVSPYAWRAVKEDGVVTVSGVVPSEAAKSDLAQSLTSGDDGLTLVDRSTLADGVPAGVDWANATTFSADILAGLKDGTVTITDTAFAASGEAKTVDAFKKARDQIGTALPAGLTLSSEDIRPPTVSPYTLVAKRDSNGVVITGFAPDDDIAARITERAARRFGSALERTDITLASGAPRGYDAAVNSGLFGLSRLEEGEFGLEDTSSRLTGVVPLGAPLDEIKTRFENGLPPGFSGVASLTQDEPPAEEVKADQCGVQVAEALSTNRIFFQTAKAAILADSFGLLDKIAATALSCPSARFEVAGHTDSDGAEAFNQQLSEARALAVTEYLVRAGVAEDRLKPVGFGEAQPVAPNDTPQNKALNRRIEFTLIE
ncbi:MAG: OmpA family protein [Pseudomonadota bacterium]